MNEFIMEFLQEKSSLENINALMHYDNIILIYKENGIYFPKES